MGVSTEEHAQTRPERRSWTRRLSDTWSRLEPHWTPPVNPRLRRVLLVFATLGLAFTGAWLALAIAGTSQGLVGPLVVDASIQPSLEGESVIRVDPLGTLVVDSHRAPISMHVSVRAVDEAGIQNIVDDPSSLVELDDRLVADLRAVIVDAGIRGAVVGVLGAALAAGLVLRSVRRALLAGAVALVSIGGSYGLAAVTFDAEAVRSPTYTGLFEAAPQLVGSVEDIAANFDAYAEQLAGIVTNVGALYDTTVSLPTFRPDDDTIRLLHVADLHLNPAAWNIIDSVARQYDVDVIVDAGDIADHGTPLENNYVRPISTLGRPYVFVKGNHDSVATVAAIAAQPNTIVLDNEPVEVAGLRFFGAPDPRFTPDQSLRGTASEDILRASEELGEAARALDPAADVLVFHDPSHAQLLDGGAPLVLAGHGHRRDTYVLDEGTRVMMQGSTGGAGLRALQGEEPTPVMLSVLYLDAETKRLVAWDDITLGGLGLTTAQIERHQAGEAPGDAAGTPAPTPGLEN
ncbi:metallophosphoesterase family protein [Phytoactinopolyspora limicola]|uniref:metallophosphoesterase family protein n=1 Tax=Phytoactinopolyspora limicola TaxID=2715536 RepID=UPI001A9CA9E8|nr:metallophosphoesterase [Phytoactinopolyspora limicola]